MFEYRYFSAAALSAFRDLRETRAPNRCDSIPQQGKGDQGGPTLFAVEPTAPGPVLRHDEARVVVLDLHPEVVTCRNPVGDGPGRAADDPVDEVDPMDAVGGVVAHGIGGRVALEVPAGLLDPVAGDLDLAGKLEGGGAHDGRVVLPGHLEHLSGRG